MKMLEHFEKIIANLSEKGLCDDFYINAKENLEIASAFLHVNQIQTVLFALLLDNIGEGPGSVIKLSEILKCRKLEMLKFLDDFEVLENKRLIRSYKNNTNSPRSLILNKDNFPKYSVPLDVIKAIRKGEEYKNKTYMNLSPEDFFDYASELLDATAEDDLDMDSLVIEINSLLEQNKHICFVKSLGAYDLHEESVLIMLIFSCNLLHNNEEVLQMRNLCNILGWGEVKRIQRRFQSKKHKLFVSGLIEFDCQMGMANTEDYRLSQKAKDEFLADVDLKKTTKQQGKNIISSEEINAKKMYYGEKIQNRIRELTELLKEDNFLNIQKRLAENGMRTGFSCIFSGPPGTGKTETVYQIAKDTGRDIFLVDIAETKSMWFGESEKCIKGIFDRYQGMAKFGSKIPILFFNEADAILGKRRELSQTRSGPDQTENAIQNIILQEMENLKGILIATTNLTINLDKAFERRFLYKIDFEKPDTVSKRMIWQSLIPDLPEEDALQLASKFDFSGGQIENISRKRAVEFVLSGTEPSLERLITFCQEEQLIKDTAFRIGFAAN